MAASSAESNSWLNASPVVRNPPSVAVALFAVPSCQRRSEQARWRRVADIVGAGTALGMVALRSPLNGRDAFDGPLDDPDGCQVGQWHRVTGRRWNREAFSVDFVVTGAAVFWINRTASCRWMTDASARASGSLPAVTMLLDLELRQPISAPLPAFPSMTTAMYGSTQMMWVARDARDAADRAF